MDESGMATGITVSGHGEASAPPDIATLEVGVQTSAETVAESRGRAAEAAAAVIDAVKGSGVEAADIQTSGFSIQPEYSEGRGGRERRVTSYTVTNMLRVKVRELDSLSTVLDGAAVAGGDEARVRGISFDREDTAALATEARAQAMADARERAVQLAELAGVTLGAPVAISEDQTHGSSPRFEMEAPRMMAMATDAATPIESGTGKVTVNVVVRWGIA